MHLYVSCLVVFFANGQIFFGAITTIGVIWVFFFVPETKGRTLEEMDEVFGQSGFAQEDLQRKTRIENEIGLTALLEGDVSPVKDVQNPMGDEAAEHQEKLVGYCRC